MESIGKHIERIENEHGNAWIKNKLEIQIKNFHKTCNEKYNLNASIKPRTLGR